MASTKLPQETDRKGVLSMKMRACLAGAVALLLAATTGGCPFTTTTTGNGNENANTSSNTNANDNDNDNDNSSSTAGDATAGESFYSSNNCATCHGADASGGIGPNLQNETDADEVLHKLDGTESHGGGTVDGVTAQDAANIVAWLATL
ncbi:MAG: hypothetical protein D6744_15205 [Planctomycetota bacterium]|nr:MAG: hypothetical protein D6744_15205 [Planctomycetota bacterium]